MSLRQQIIFDLDDTLIHCNKYFEEILSRFASQLLEWLDTERLTTEAILAKQTEIDIAGVKKVGFVSSHFVESLIDTYRYFCSVIGRDTNLAEEECLAQLGMSVYDQEVEPYPDMEETLNVLSEQGHELNLYTGGDDLIQQRKIDRMKLSAYFEDRIYIRTHKNAEALEEILQSRPFDRNNTWMIGNSLRTDIAPALTAGINTIYIKHPKEWSYNLIDLKKDTNTSMYTISSLEQVPGIIAESLAMIVQKNIQ
ncbi:HAD family hydrolase [Paenibacillus lentus]|uniref:HAD family hydrolase n=1 Tax=Paenibacillus lentus TaxID=1338368 RepID=A0A3S8RX38_9BACL|nr:HAD family hydrolase [Paenibacillus lentus]AZK47404.1 HAD family hydrolase [Paenibacillus lentus]